MKILSTDAPMESLANAAAGATVSTIFSTREEVGTVGVQDLSHSSSLHQIMLFALYISADFLGKKDTSSSIYIFK